jgi:hypothetical protein
LAGSSGIIILLTISKHFSLLKAKTVLIIAFKKQERYFHIMLMKQNNMSSGRLQHFHFKYVYQKSQIIHKNHSKAIPWRPCRRKKKKKNQPPLPLPWSKYTIKTQTTGGISISITIINKNI